MRTLRISVSAVGLCGAIFALSGCHSQANEANGVPFPAPHAAPSVQAQVQEIENNPHIPAEQKATLEAQIKNGGSAPTSSQHP